MPVSTLDQAIASHSFQPKGIKVSPDLWRELVSAGRITWKRGYLEGAIDSGIDFPVLDNSIFVHVDPELEDYGYQLPPKA